MDDRIYELMTKMYSEMTQQFESVKGEIGGYKQNTEILQRIEKQVSKHEEIIMRRIK